MKVKVEKVLERESPTIDRMLEASIHHWFKHNKNSLNINANLQDAFNEVGLTQQIKDIEKKNNLLILKEWVNELGSSYDYQKLLGDENYEEIFKKFNVKVDVFGKSFIIYTTALADAARRSGLQTMLLVALGTSLITLPMGGLPAVAIISPVTNFLGTGMLALAGIGAFPELQRAIQFAGELRVKEVLKQINQQLGSNFLVYNLFNYFQKINEKLAEKAKEIVINNLLREDKEFSMLQGQKENIEELINDLEQIYLICSVLK